jgi:hypothetical protein
VAAIASSLNRLLLAALVSGVGVPVALAQTSYVRELWPELQVHYRFDERTKVIGLVNHSRYRDSDVAYQAEIGAALDHRFTDVFSGRIGYRHGQSTDGGPFREDRLMLEQTFRVALPAAVMVDFRTREDFRWLDSGFSMRFRERVQVQRDTMIGDYSFTPYVSAEVFYDTRFDQFSRYRLTAGTTFPLGKHLSLEPYLAHQLDFARSSTLVDAVGLVLTVSF